LRISLPATATRSPLTSSNAFPLANASLQADPKQPCGLHRELHRQLLEDFLAETVDRKSTRLNSSHLGISYAVFCLKKKINGPFCWSLRLSLFSGVAPAEGVQHRLCDLCRGWAGP